VVGLEERPPHLEEIEVSDCGYDNIELILQKGSRRNRASRHWRKKHRKIYREIERLFYT